MSDEKSDLLCEDCGQELSSFLQEMAEHNAKVTACPKCGKNHEFKTPQSAEPVPANHPSRKPI
jgi:transcription elongation factor Elf1